MENFQKVLSGNGESYSIPVDGVGKAIEVITASQTLTADQSGKLLLIGTDALVLTLPSTEAGLVYNFANIGAAGNNIITVSPAAADGIAGTITLAATVVVLDGTIDKDVINTKASSQAGDALTVTATGTAGTTAWLSSRDSGIWAREV